MARPKQIVPSYQLHKSTGQARTYLDGRDYYLGPYGSDESLIRYGELIGRFSSGLVPIDPLSKPKTDDEVDKGPSVAEVILAFSFTRKSTTSKTASQRLRSIALSRAVVSYVNDTAYFPRRTLDRSH